MIVEKYVTSDQLRLPALNPHSLTGSQLSKWLLVLGMTKRARRALEWSETPLFDLQSSCTELVPGEDIHTVVYGETGTVRELSLKDDQAVATEAIPLEVWELYATLFGQKRFDRFTLDRIDRDGEIESALVGHFRDPDGAQHRFLLARWGVGLKSLETLLAAKAAIEATQEAEAMAEALRKQDEERRKARQARRARLWRKWPWALAAFGVFAVCGFVYWLINRPAPLVRSPVAVDTSLERVVDSMLANLSSLLPWIVIIALLWAMILPLIRRRS